MELRQLEYFAAVAEVLNFGQAAARPSIGQPAVSQQVRRLERELGVTLFDRTSRSVRLTEAGQRLLPEARAVLVAVERARQAATARGAGRLRLGTSTGLGERLERVLDAIGPHVQVELVSTSTRARLERVRAGQLDAAFVRGVDEAAGLELIPVWQDALHVALPAAHELASTPAVAIGDLRALPLRIVGRRDNPPLVDLVVSACAAAGFEPVMGPPNVVLADTLAAIGTGPASWTVVYAAHARTMRSTRVAFRPLVPALAMQTALAVPASATSRSLAPLLRACTQAGADAT